VIEVVANDETLYRRVQFGRDHYTVEQGVVRISSQAFSDSEFKPSVDRAILRDNNPRNAMKAATDGILTLVASDVRSIPLQRFNPDVEYLVDVLPDAIENDPELPDNPAHAKICTTPPCEKNVFRRLKEALAQLASGKWSVKPPDVP